MHISSVKCDLFIRGRISHRMGTRGWMEWSATLGAQITSLSCFHQKGRHAESQIRSLSFSLSFSPAFISFIHSVTHSLTGRLLHRWPVLCVREYFYPENYLWGLTTNNQRTTDNRRRLAVLYLRIYRWHTIFIYYSFSCKIVP